jgi:putative membrane protein
LLGKRWVKKHLKLLISNKVWSAYVGLFFLGCVIIAGIYGALTASNKIFFVQALPAIVALIFVLLNNL